MTKEEVRKWKAVEARRAFAGVRKERSKAESEAAAERIRQKFEAILNRPELQFYETDLKPSEQLLGLDIFSAIYEIIKSVKQGLNLEEIIRNVAIRPELDWTDDENIRAIFLASDFVDDEDVELARTIFETLLKAGKIVHRGKWDKRTQFNCETWIGLGIPWE